MRDRELVDPLGAVREAEECCGRIASVLEDAIGEAKRLGDEEMLARLVAAKAAADRGIDLIGKLSRVLADEQPDE